MEFPEELKAQKVWGVVSTWSVDVFYDELTYDEAMEFARNPKAGEHHVVVLMVARVDGPPMTRRKSGHR